MKRLLFIVILVGIGAYIFFQIRDDRRFNPAGDYDYPINEQIDKKFYDQTVVRDYYKAAYEVGNYARSLWNYDGIDVRFPDRAKEKSKEATEYWVQLKATAKWLETRLLESKEYKDQGYNNEQIKLIMEQDLTPEDMNLRAHHYLIGLKRGSNGAEVWELQKMLNLTGDSIPEDGLFNLITTNRVREFQRENGLFPSGEIDMKTLETLLK